MSKYCPSWDLRMLARASPSILLPSNFSARKTFKALGRGRKNYFVEKFRTDYALLLE